MRCRKRICAALLLGLLCLLLTGCSGGEKGKIRDLECTVLTEDEIPQPLAEVIEENKTKEMKLSYQKDGALYIARGFGEQATGGYSIMVDHCYLGEDGIHVKFTLEGPSADDQPVEEATWPYIVIQMEAMEENIIFDE